MSKLRTIFGAAVLLSTLLSQVGCVGTYGMDDLFAEGGVLGPQMEVEPSLEVVFPEVPEGGSVYTEVLIVSVGDMPLAVDSVTLEGPDANLFVVPSLPLPLMLPAGGDMPVRVAFLPDAEGQFHAELVITTRNEEDLTLRRDVIGQACRDWDEDLVCDYGGPSFDSADTGW